jgi:hypothetical protein
MQELTTSWWIRCFDRLRNERIGDAKTALRVWINYRRGVLQVKIVELIERLRDPAREVKKDARKIAKERFRSKAVERTGGNGDGQTLGTLTA